MIGSQTLPALALLAAISGIPGLKGLPMPATKEYARAKAEAAAADTLPPPWKPSWRLALENTFVTAALTPIGKPFGPIKLLPASDPRKLSVSVDPDSGVYVSSVEVGEVTLGAAYRRPLDEFSRELSAITFRDHWLDRSRRDVNTLGAGTPIQHTGISVPIPVHMPGPVRTWLGPGSPALNVSGSESIRLSGTSNWTNQNLVLLGQRSSLFPSLDMQQDLDIRLEGQLSDRVKVNLLQNSANQVPLANRIAINYRGEEDDFIQALDLGNTSLSLPGTQYVSYSGKNEGLFGIKLASRIGPLDFTGLASKQEGRSEHAVYAPGGTASGRYPFKDLDWVKGQYFLLYDPNFGTAYDIDDKSITLYIDDGVTSNDHNVTAGKAMIDPGGVMGMPLSAGAKAASVPGSFDLLNPGADQQYEVLNNVYAFHDTIFKVIRLKQKILPQSNYTLAVTYRATPMVGPGQPPGTPFTVGDTLKSATPGVPDSIVMKLLRAPYTLQTSQDGATFDTTADLALVRELELKNFYDLGGFGIDPKSFKLMLQFGQNDPPITDLHGIPFIQMVGLDSWNEQTSQALPGHDGQVDATGFNSQTRGWVDYANGVLFLPDPRPFAPRLTGPGAHPFDIFIDQLVRRDRHLDGTPPDSVNVPNPGAYDLRVPQINDARWNFTAEFAAARSGGGDITLGRGNILEGSEAVVVNGERWLRDRDYTIDYDLGRVMLKRQLGPQDQLSIDYSYAPLFAQASKTLIGSAFRAEGRDRSIGGAFLYQSQGAQDLRPRLGEEPSRTLITDLNTEFHLKPAWLTRLADALPGVRTTTPSEMNIQAEAGMSFPNPNTQNEVFVDDMEGVRDAVSLSLTPDRWRWSSVPSRATTVVDGIAVATQKLINVPGVKYAEVHWFTPVNTRGNTTDNELVHERDLRPLLPDAQGAQNVRTVLAVSMPRAPSDFSAGQSMWTGLTYNLDSRGLDVSRSQFIEVWVDDWNDHHDPAFHDPRIRGDGTPGSSVKLHIDLGRVSEDQMRAPNRLPNHHLDTEDRGNPPDGQLTVTGGQSEDTGVDGIDDAAEKDSVTAGKLEQADLTTASAGDPEGDDWNNIIENFPSAVDPHRYVKTNGTEGNHTAFPIPDTEDMSGDGVSDSTEAYFEYTIDLGPSSPYLVTDVLRDFPGESVSDPTKNGWRRYRIPLTDSLRVRFGFPDLTVAQHVRVWLDGVKKVEKDPLTGAEVARPMIMIGGLDIVGSRWQNSDLTLRQRDTLRTTVTLNSVNTVDNAEIYRAPFDPGTTRNGNQEYQRREQSISLEFTDLFAADTLEAFKTFSLPENYSRYGVLRWFAAGFNVTKRNLAGDSLGIYDPAQDSLSYFVRFASDDRGENYYEIKRPLPRSSTPLDIGWEEVLGRVEQISQVKLNSDFVNLRDPILYHTILPNGDRLTIKGRPSFTRLLRISFGVLNEDTTRAYRYSGQLWFDELRATDVARDVGLANRVLVNGRWANLMDYNVAWNSRDADFLSVGDTRGSGSHDTNLNVSTHFEPQRFFEGTGILVPVTFSQNEFTSRPRFSAGDDIVRTGTVAVQSETHTVSRALGASYSRVWSDRSNPFLRYTLGGLNANINRSTTDANAPTYVSKNNNVSAGVTYQVSLRQLLPVALPLTKAQLFLLPERFYWNYGVSTTKSSAYTRTFGSDVLTQSSSQNGRAANVDFGADVRPLDMLTYHVEGHRNLSLDGVRMDRVGFINFGRLTGWRQAFNSHMALNPNQWVRPSFNWSSTYVQANDTQSPELIARGISNSQELGANWDLPFDRLTGPPVGMARTPARHDTSGRVTHAPRTRRPLLPWRALLSHLGPLSTDGRIGRNSNYSRVTGTASPLYLVGLAENPGFGDGKIFEQPGNTSATGLDWRTNAHTNVPVVFGSSIAARFSYGDRTSNNNGVLSRTRDWRFPDLEVQYGRVADMIGLAHILQGPQLRTAYARSYSVDYQNSRSLRAGNSRSDDWRPLFSVRGRFRNGTDADLRFERRSSVREAFQVGSSRQTDQTTNVNFSLSRSYSQGQKVNVLGRSSTVKTSVNLQLTTVYERQKGGIQIGNDATLSSPIDRTRLSLNGTASYGFSTNVTGDLALGFSHFHETTGIVRRSIRVELRGQFRF